jgi:hypothetical protein
MLDPEHTIEIKLARASGNGSGVRVEPHEVPTLLKWKRKYDADQQRAPLHSARSAIERSEIGEAT